MLTARDLENPLLVDGKLETSLNLQTTNPIRQSGGWFEGKRQWLVITYLIFSRVCFFWLSARLRLVGRVGWLMGLWLVYRLAAWERLCWVGEAGAGGLFGQGGGNLVPSNSDTPRLGAWSAKRQAQLTPQPPLPEPTAFVPLEHHEGTFFVGVGGLWSQWANKSCLCHTRSIRRGKRTAG